MRFSVTRSSFLDPDHPAYNKRQKPCDGAKQIEGEWFVEVESLDELVKLARSVKREAGVDLIVVAPDEAPMPEEFLEYRRTLPRLVIQD